MLLAGGRRVGDRLCQRGGFDVANRVVRQWLQRLLVSQLPRPRPVTVLRAARWRA